MATERVYQGFTRGSHATTFGGNPLVSAVAKTVLDVIEEHDLCARAEQMGAYMMEGLRDLQSRYDVITDVRGRGLMVGAEVGEAASSLVGHARDHGLLINSAGGDTLRFVPPLIVGREDIDEALRRLKEALKTWSQT